jgi:5-methylcytosine-specific restriction protein A
MKKSLRPCNKMGCTALTRDAYCSVHQTDKQELKREQQRSYDKTVRDPKYKQFYNSSEWQRAREQALIRDHHLCVMCKANGRYTRADVVDHIHELRDPGGWELRTVLTNLQSLCHRHHNRKTFEEKKKRD